MEGKDNPDVLREKVLKIEARIRKIMDADPRWNDDYNKREKIKSFLSDRAHYLNRMFLATQQEVSRFEKLNQMLVKKVDDMHQRAAMLWETMLTMRQMPEFDDSYEVRGELKVYGDRSDSESILRLPEDDYYGSDFALANEAIVATISADNWSHAYCGHCINSLDTATEDRDHGRTFFNTMENGESWAEADLRHPALEHICICHPIHDMVTHVTFSIPDILRINNFSTKVWLEVSNEITQAGIRSIDKSYRS